MIRTEDALAEVGMMSREELAMMSLSFSLVIDWISKNVGNPMPAIEYLRQKGIDDGVLADSVVRMREILESAESRQN